MKDKEKLSEELSETLDTSETSISEDAKLDAIIDFYKDKPLPEENSDIKEDGDDGQNPILSFVRQKLKIPFDKKIETNSDDDEAITSDSHGLDKKRREITRYIITALICIAILAGSYLLALKLPGDTQKVTEYADEIRKDNEYVTVMNKYNALTHDVAELKAANEAKKEKADSLTDFENAKAALRTEIEKKSEELNAFNKQIIEKRNTIDTLNASIAQKTPSAITLNAGKYVIGTNIAAGKYLVTGSGTFSAASSDNTSKYNFLLKDGSQEVSLEKGDIIKINAETKFTSVN